MASLDLDEVMKRRYATSPSVARMPTMVTTVRSSSSVKARCSARRRVKILIRRLYPVSAASTPPTSFLKGDRRTVRFQRLIALERQALGGHFRARVPQIVTVE